MPDDAFGGNDRRPQEKPKKKPITEGDVVWWGKHRGKPAEAVDPGYWRWAADNLDWLEVDPVLYEDKARMIGPNDCLGFGKYADTPGIELPADYVMWAKENLQDIEFCEEILENAENGPIQKKRERYEPDTRFDDSDPPF